MKTRSSKFYKPLSGLLTGALCLILFSAHRIEPSAGTTNSPATASSSVTREDMDEYIKVLEYVEANICTPMRNKLKAGYGSNPKDYFSRCPSGYEPEFVLATDSVTTDRFVTGKILFYKGCVPKDVCRFKVCVDKGFAVVRSKNSKEYMSVSKWIAMRNESAKQAVKS